MTFTLGLFRRLTAGLPDDAEIGILDGEEVRYIGVAEAGYYSGQVESGDPFALTLTLKAKEDPYDG